MLKRCLSLILAFVMVFSLLPVQALAEGAPEAEGEVLIQETLAPEADPEPETEPVTEPETEPVTEPETEPVTEPETEPVTEPVTEPATEPETEPETEPATEPEMMPKVLSMTECSHSWELGICSLCGAECDHYYDWWTNHFQCMYCGLCLTEDRWHELPASDELQVVKFTCSTENDTAWMSGWDVKRLSNIVEHANGNVTCDATLTAIQFEMFPKAVKSDFDEKHGRTHTDFAGLPTSDITIPLTWDAAAGVWTCETIEYFCTCEGQAAEPESNSVTFTFSLPGGEASMEPVTVRIGEELVLPECTAENPGHVFRGWDIGRSDGTWLSVGGAFSETGTREYKPGDRILITADLFDDETYDYHIGAIWRKVSGNIQMYFHVQDQPIVKTVTIGETFTVPACDIEVPGYRFEYWYMQREDGMVLNADGDFVENFNAEHHPFLPGDEIDTSEPVFSFAAYSYYFVAKLARDDSDETSITLTFDKGLNTWMDGYPVKAGDVFTIPGNPNENPGHEFVGWFLSCRGGAWMAADNSFTTDESVSSRLFVPGDEFPVTEETLNLTDPVFHAIWKDAITIKNYIADTCSTVKYGDLYQFPESDGQILYWAIQRSDDTMLDVDGTFQDMDTAQWQLYEPGASIVIDADLFDGSKYTYTLCYISDDNGGGGTNEGSSAYVSDETGLNNAIEAWFNDIYIEEDITLTDVLTIPEGISLYIESGATLTVPADQTLTIEGNLYIDGTVKVAPGACICTADQDGTWIGVWSGTLDVTGADISGFDLDRVNVDLGKNGQVLGIPTTSLNGRFDIYSFEDLKAAALQAPQYQHVEFYINQTVTVTKDLEIPANVSITIWSYGDTPAELAIASGVNMVHNGNLQVGDDAILNVAENAQFTVRGYFSVNSTAKIINNGTISYTRNKYYFDPGHIYEGTGKMNIIKAPGLTESQLHDALLNSDEYHIYLTDDITLTKNLSITEDHAVHVEEGATLTVPSGKTLTIKGDLYIDGTVKVARGAHICTAGQGWPWLGVWSGTLDVTGADISGLDLDRVNVDLGKNGQVLGIPTTSLNGRFDIYSFEDLKAAALQAPQYQYVEFNINQTVTVTKDLEIPANVSITIWGYGDTPAELAIASGVNMVHNGNLQVGDNAILNVAENAQLTVFENLYANSTAKIVNYGTIYYAYFNYDDGYSYEGSGQMLKYRMNEEQLRAALEGEETDFDFNGEITLTRNLVIPQGYTLNMVDGASITVPEGISLIVEGGLYMLNSTVKVVPGASLIIPESNWGGWITVSRNSHLDVTGANLSGQGITLYLNGGGQISGIPSTNHQASADVETLDQLKTYLAMASQYDWLIIHLSGDITVTEELEIPSNATVQIEWNWKRDNETDTEYKAFGGITVAPGAKLKNRGHIYVTEGCTLTVSEGSELSCSGSMYIDTNGILVNDGIIYGNSIDYDSSAIIRGNGQWLPYEMTEDELHEALLDNGAYLEFAGNMTLTRDLTIPSNSTIHLNNGGKLTVSEGVTLTIDGYLHIHTATLKVEEGGVLKTTGSDTWRVHVDLNGILDVTGTDVSGIETGSILFWYPDSDSVRGIPAEKLDVACMVGSYTDLVNVLAWADQYHLIHAQCTVPMTISKDVYIPENVYMEIWSPQPSSGTTTPAKITVASGATVTNGGHIIVHENATLTINSGCELDNSTGIVQILPGATLVNNGTVTSFFDSCNISNEAIVKGTGKFRVIDELVEISSVDEIMEAYANGATILKIVNSNIVFTEDTTLPKDLELEFIDTDVTIDEGVTVTCATNRALSFTSNSTLYLNGAVDAKEIFIDNGSAVVPEEKIISKVKAPVGGWYIKLGIPKVESLTIWEIVEGVTIEPVLDVDMKYKPTAQLSITSEPQYSSQIVTWKTSSSTIATVNADGLVTFKKPGTVTITATAADGSKVSTSVKFKVTYLDPATKLTAVAEVPELGLEESYTTTMLVYGTDKENALKPLDLTFTSSNNAIASVDGNGTITAGEKVGTATITAAITGDPLGRKVSVKVKVIPLQTKSLHLEPEYVKDGDSILSRIIPTNPDSGEVPKYEVSLDAYYIASGARTFVVHPVAVNTKGEVIENLTASSLEWVSADTKVATVVANADGSATVTLKAAGATVISATTTDLAAQSWEISVYVCDYAPRLEGTSVTLNTYTYDKATMPMIPAYEKKVLDVTVHEYDKATKTYRDEASDRLSAYRLFDDPNTLYIDAEDVIEQNGTIKVQLRAIVENCPNPAREDGAYTYNISVKIANSEPSITVKQPVKFNTHTGLGTDLTFTAKNAQITDVVLVPESTTSFVEGADFDPETGILLLEASDAHLNGEEAMDAKIEVDVYLEGYREPIPKVVTVATSSTKPTITVKQPEKFNLFYKNWVTLLQVTAKNMDVERVELVGTDSFEPVGGFDFNNGTLAIKLTKDYLDGEVKLDTSATLRLYPVGYETPIEKAITIKTVTTKPSLSLTPASSTINTELESKTTFISVYDKATGGMVLNPEDVTVTDIDSFATYEVVDGGIQLELTGDKGGTATIAVQLSNWTQPIKLTHKITAKDTLPAPVLGTSTLKLHRIFTWTTADTTAKLNQSNYDIYDIKFTPVTAGSDGIILDYENGIITAFFDENMDPAKAPKNGNYKFDYVVILDNEAHTELAKKTITVNVSSTVPTAKLKASTLKLNRIFTKATAETTVTLSKSDYDILDIKFDPVTASADDIILTYADGIITASFDEDMDPANAPKNGNYKFNYVVILDNEAQTKLAKQTITVNVSSTVPTAKLKASTLTLNKNLGTFAVAQTTVSLSKGTGYTIVGMVPKSEISSDIQVKFDPATGTLSAYLLNEAAAAKSHTIYLHPVLWNEAAEQEVTLSSTVKLTVAVKAQTISASISTKGKLDTMNPDSAINYTVSKLNNIVGEVVNVSPEDDMGLFDVVLDTTGSKPVAVLTRKDGAEVATNVTYKLKLVFEIEVNTSEGPQSYYVSTSVSFKVSQSALKFVTIPTQKLYLFQKELVTTVALNTPVTATFSDNPEHITLSSKTATAFKKAMGDGVVTFELIDGGRSAEVHFAIEHPGYLVNGKSYTVYLDITPADNATNVKPTQLKLTVKAYK